MKMYIKLPHYQLTFLFKCVAEFPPLPLGNTVHFYVEDPPVHTEEL